MQEFSLHLFFFSTLSMSPLFKIKPFGVVLSLIFTSSLVLAAFYFDVEYNDLFGLSTFSAPPNTNAASDSSVKPIQITIDEVMTIFDFKNNTLSAPSLRGIWQCLFYDLVLRPKYSISTAHRIAQHCVDHQYYRPSLSLNHYLHLTNLTVSTLSPSNDYRSLLSIRRYLLMIAKHSDTENTLFSDTTPTHLFQSIIHQFASLNVETMQFLAHSIRNRVKKYFNIHVVKSAGSTVCRTFNGLGFATSSPNSLNCNVRSTNSAWKLPDFGAIPCSNYFRNSGKYDMIAFERPMHGQGEVRIPTLCDQFVYILPFRHPIRRIYSLIDQVACSEYFLFWLNQLKTLHFAS